MSLNSGRAVTPNFAEAQTATRSQLLDCIVDALAQEQLVEAAWLVGSLARDDFDALSDVDLVVIATEGHAHELVDALPRLAAACGDVALAYRAPQNAPAQGTQLNVLYDLSPLPTYCDWSVWPAQPLRPTDAKVLIERDSERFRSEGTFDDILAGLPRGSGTAEIDEFRLYMVPIAAKEAVRGRIASVEGILTYMKLPMIRCDSTRAALADLDAIARMHGGSRNAVDTVLRYLAELRKVA